MILLTAAMLAATGSACRQETAQETREDVAAARSEAREDVAEARRDAAEEAADTRNETAQQAAQREYDVAIAKAEGEYKIAIERCDAVILANGDCGACSSSGIQNVIELEKRGIPTLLVSTPPFLGACQAMKSMGGMPDLQWAVVEHPICSISDDELRARAVSAVEQFQSIILQRQDAPASGTTKNRESVAA